MLKTQTKSKELLMKLEPNERLVVGTAYCGQNLRTGEILELSTTAQQSQCADSY